MAITLDELFDAYEKRKAGEARQLEEKAAKAKRDRDAALEVLRGKALPAFQQLAGQIRPRGHEASVTNALDEDPPKLTFEFTPAKGPATPSPMVSRLHVRWTGADMIEVLQEIARSSSRGIGERRRLVEISDAWVAREVVSLVEAALKHH